MSQSDSPSVDETVRELNTRIQEENGKLHQVLDLASSPTFARLFLGLIRIKKAIQYINPKEYLTFVEIS